MDIFYIAVAAIAPIALILAGTRLLGSQTHPAAIFILAWILCSFVLSLAEAVPVSPAILSLVWVAICYGAITLIRKARITRRDSPLQNSVEEPGE
jgi:lysylphosphatidylglycerol synthetase-like protein (DUF2156 family)